MSEQLMMMAASWGFSGACFFASFLYPSWYANKARPGDTIGMAYTKDKFPIYCFFAFLFAVSAAFNSCPWRVALVVLVVSPIAAGLLLTVFRSKMQLLGPLGGVAGIVAAVVVIVSTGKPLPLN